MLTIQEIANAVKQAMEETGVELDEDVWPLYHSYNVGSKQPHGNISVTLLVEGSRRKAQVHHGVNLIATLTFSPK